MFYDPAYRINGLVRAFTAAVSLATAVSLVRLVPLALSAPVTILAQQTALRQQHEWLRDILDSATGGVLKLCRTEADLPDALGDQPLNVQIINASQLRKVREIVQDLAHRADFDRERAGEMLTSVHEAAMNALKHGGGAVVRAYVYGDTVQVWIEDKGAGIPLDKLPLATLKQGYSTVGTAGQGWFMVLSFVDRADLFTGPDGTCLVLQMKRRAGANQVPFAAAVGGDIQR